MKKTLITMLLALLVISAVSAGFTCSPGFQGTLGASFCHPTSSYLKTSQARDLPEIRTSFYADFDAMLATVRFDNNLEVGLGFALQWTSQSLAAGIHVLQPYVGSGVALTLNKIFNREDKCFALGIKTRLMFCKYRPYNYKFNTIDIALVPSKRVFNDSNYDIFMICPVTFSKKSDAFTVRAGLGFNVKYNVRLNIENTRGEKDK